MKAYVACLSARSNVRSKPMVDFSITAEAGTDIPAADTYVDRRGLARLTSALRKSRMSYQSHTTEAGIKSLIVEIGPDANVRIILGWTDKNAHLPFLQKQLRSEEERLKSGSSKSDYWIKQLQKEMKQPRNRPLEIDLTSSWFN